MLYALLKLLKTLFANMQKRNSHILLTKKQIIISLYFALISVYGLSQNSVIKNKADFPGFPTIKKVFINPGDDVQTGIYWYWLSDNISKESVVKDLESMKKAGVNRAFIGNISLPDVTPGKIKFFSEEWWDVLHTALKTATKLNIEIGIFNSPGWSQSGGPWINEEQSMRYLSSSQVTVEGGKKIIAQLKKPVEKFQDVKVIAFPTKDYKTNITDFNAIISSEQFQKKVGAVMDNDTSTYIDVPLDSTIVINIETADDFTARSIVVYPSHRPLIANVKIQAKLSGNFKTIKEFIIDRGNASLNVGFNPYGSVAVSLPVTKTNCFRLIVSNQASNYSKSWGGTPAEPGGLQEIQISSSPKIESYIEKSLAKMCQTPFPLWGQYLWPNQISDSEYDLYIHPSTVMDISKYMTADGMLDWDAPEGKWTIMRTGMVSTGVVNSPAPANGTGLEVDKMNSRHLHSHFAGFLGEIMKRIPVQDRKTWKIAVLDSYETGAQNWTDSLIEKFTSMYGYDPSPYIPVLFGNVIGDEEISNRFLWDLRRFVADKVSYEYVGGLRNISHAHGLTTWLENYGHWGFPGEFLQYGGQSDEIGGEFWSEGDLGNIENRAATSCGHIYGKSKISAESHTCGGLAYSRHPGSIKQRGDRFFAEGINSTILHVYISQPNDYKLPGLNTGFGNEFNRNNNWFSQMDVFTQYLKRTNLLLQQGLNVADVAYFIGEDVPKMTGITDPPLPVGYQFDYINAEVIEKYMTVQNGMLTLPHGTQYKILVLPKLETMRPSLLAKIKQLVTDGAIILGPAPKTSPSLQNYPEADQLVHKWASELWGTVDGRTSKYQKFGKGIVIDGMSLGEAFDLINLIPDCKLPDNNSIHYSHRKIPEGDIYFISNQSDTNKDLDIEFRVTDMQPQLWDPVTGYIRDLPSFKKNVSTTAVPLKLETNESVFVVFRKSHNKKSNGLSGKNYPKPTVIDSLTGPWEVSFKAHNGDLVKTVYFDTLQDWITSSDNQIKYFSGTAIYKNNFKIAQLPVGNELFINLGSLTAMAKITINGKYAGGVWTPPYQLKITDLLVKGENEIIIEVVNNWMNRLIGDLNVPEKEKMTWSLVNPYTPQTALQPSGLLGPVKILATKY